MVGFPKMKVKTLSIVFSPNKNGPPSDSACRTKNFVLSKQYARVSSHRDRERILEQRVVRGQENEIMDSNRI